MTSKRKKPTESKLSNVGQQKSRHGGRQQLGEQRRNAGKQKQDHQSPQQEEEAEVHGHVVSQRRLPPLAMWESAGKPDVASAVVTREVEIVVVLVEGCVVGVEGEELSERRAGQ